MREHSVQEKFWAGEFGDKYIERNSLEALAAPKTAMWADILHHLQVIPKSIFKVGCNIGKNLQAIRNLLPTINVAAVEINTKAAKKVSKNIKNIDIYNCAFLDFDNTEKMYDFVFTSGVLIHINPEQLDIVYKKIYSLSRKYILLNEYYNPVPVKINYRGNEDKLFKRDFAGDMLNMYSTLKLIAYRFIYHNDNIFPGDDCTWFLLEKTIK